MASPSDDRHRLKAHPILPVTDRKKVRFSFNGKDYWAYEGEMISSALIANGEYIFGLHPRDNAPQGIFCVNGQCSQCMVIVDGLPVKGCMTSVKEGMNIISCFGRPGIPPADTHPPFSDCETIETQVLVIGGGPAGINAARELGELGIKTLIVDDKPELGGKLTLQTHPFFGSIEDCYAGTRGIRIAEIMTEDLEKLESVSVLTGTAAVGVFCDRKVGMYDGKKYFLVKPEAVLVACGAREKTLVFPGSDLPGIYGAGAFQTLLNRDLVKPTDRLFIVGGGNVGLIAGYHAVQAGIEVVGLIEALPKCSGYKVHEDKLRRIGVPVLTSHTVIKAEGKTRLERITIAQVDGGFTPVKGTERAFDVDTLLVAVGLSPVNELYEKLEEFGFNCFNCGDSEEIAEASAAIFSGKITGRKIAHSLGHNIKIPREWEPMQEVLRSKPGAVVPFTFKDEGKDVFPVIRCVEEIPCNPCVDSCPFSSVKIPSGDIMGLPVLDGECSGCTKCVVACPALAITLVRRKYDEKKGTSEVVIPYELLAEHLSEGTVVKTVDMEGNPVGEGKIIKIKKAPGDKSRLLISLEVAGEEAGLVAGFSEHAAEEGVKADGLEEAIPDDTIVCRCERITAGEVRAEIRAGVRDMNILKATIRTGMGACGGKTCTDLILKLFKQEGIDPCDVTLPTNRPFVSEVPLCAFANIEGGDGE